MFVGIDVDSKQAHVAGTTDGETFQRNTVTPETLAEVLKEWGATAAAIEHTGRLAEPYAAAADAAGFPLFYITSQERAALNTLHRDRAKSDPRDARAIARALYVWHDPKRRAAALYPSDLFIRASMVARAWKLRSLLAICTALTQERVKAEQRVGAAIRAGDKDGAELLSNAVSTEPEKAAWQAVEKYVREKFPAQLEALLSMPGIGMSSASHIIATIMPVERFETPSQVVAYVGLHPTTIASGGKDIVRPHIPHTGNSNLRAVLFQAALTQRTAENEFGEKYRRMLAKGKHDYSARCATAHSMLKAAYAVLTKGTSKEQEAAAHAASERATPPGAITQAEFARNHGISRQRVGQMVAEGKLQIAEKNGRRYIQMTPPEASGNSEPEPDLTFIADGDQFAIPVPGEVPAAFR